MLTRALNEPAELWPIRCATSPSRPLEGSQKHGLWPLVRAPDVLMDTLITQCSEGLYCDSGDRRPRGPHPTTRGSLLWVHMRGLCVELAGATLDVDGEHLMLRLPVFTTPPVHTDLDTHDRSHVA